jgi:chemotaxis methyl-accepting protein methylase
LEAGPQSYVEENITLANAYDLMRSIWRPTRRVWERLPRELTEHPGAHFVGTCIHALSRRFSRRRQSNSTWFFRYPPLLLPIQDFINDRESGGSVRLCVVGCSTGAEMYSILSSVRQARSDLKILPTGIDISEFSIEKAKAGRYSLQDPEVLRGVSEETLAELFDRTDSGFKIKDSIGAGVEWIVGDVRDDRLRTNLGLQDIVVANNFLFHMKEVEATDCLRKIVHLVRPGGLLVCRGVDLNVRERVAQQFRLTPISKRIEDIHECDVTGRRHWPWFYWGLEPLDKRRKDWVRRYASAFRVPTLLRPDDIDATLRRHHAGVR